MIKHNSWSKDTKVFREKKYFLIKNAFSPIFFIQKECLSAFYLSKWLYIGVYGINNFNADLLVDANLKVFCFKCFFNIARITKIRTNLCNKKKYYYIQFYVHRLNYLLK